MKRTPLKRKRPLKAKTKPWLRPDGKPKRGWTKTGKPSGKSLMAKADRLARADCHARGYCQAEGWVKWNPPKSGIGKDGVCGGSLEWCHIRSRSYRSIRHDPRNCLSLCSACHRHFTRNPDEFAFFVEQLLPGTYDYLRSEIAAFEGGPKSLNDVYTFWVDYYTKRAKDEA